MTVEVIEVETLPINRINISGVNCSIIYLHMTPRDAVEGVHVELTMDAKPASTTKVYVLNALKKLSDAEIVLEIAGNTLYDLNATAAGKRHLGDWTLDFQTYTTNRLWFKQGTATGGITMPTVMAPIVMLVVEEAGFTITKAIKTKKGG